ncbi:MAG: chromosomal replication initiator protein DnaA [Planctomycetaceae bacterium]|nr:chromosomal replication initiator protein DnaA [Planctomycetaceae bacterium]
MHEVFPGRIPSLSPNEATLPKKINYRQFPSLFPVEELEDSVVESSVSAAVLTAAPKAPLPPPVPRKSELPRVGTRKYAALTTFVEGPSNRLAVTAAQMAIQFPGKLNPIYIFGGTSLGKTHLLEGICSESRKQKNRKPVLFMSAEQFTTSYIESVTKQGMSNLRSKFHDVSALLIDDLHFFQGKSGTQTELLRTIETLKSQGVQLVLAGDKPLKELVGIRPELLSRLEAGMVCEIQPPDKEMLHTIFRQMIQQRDVPISEEVSRFVVSRLNMHARQLAGAMNRLHMTCLSSGKPITVSVAEEVLDDLIRCNRRAVRLADIDKVVCETFGIGQQSLQSKSRAKQVSYPRMFAMWLARKYTRNALSEIGKYFGDRTHSTVVSAQKKVESWINGDVKLDCFDQQCSISEVLQKVERLLQAG